MEGNASISSDILARYAADAVREVPGVRALLDGHLPRHRGVRIAGEEGAVRLEVRVEVEWGASIPEVGGPVQRRVREYLSRMADVDLAGVDVVVESIHA